MNLKDAILPVIFMTFASGCFEGRDIVDEVQRTSESPVEYCYFRAMYDEERTADYYSAEVVTTWLLSRAVATGDRFPAFGEEPIMYLAAECGLEGLAREQEISVAIQEITVEVYDQAASDFMQREFGLYQ